MLRSVMQSRTAVQVVFLLAVVAALSFVVVRVSEGWADWVVLGVILVTVFGAAGAIYSRQYPTRKRSFVRHASPGPGSAAGGRERDPRS